MTTIRYRRHFLILIASIAILCFVLNIKNPRWVQDVGFRFGLIGALHSMSLVVSLRHRQPVLLSIAFIVLTSILSVMTLMIGGFPLMPFLLLLPEGTSVDLKFTLLILSTSATGAAGYWFVVRSLWLKALQVPDLVKTVALCSTASVVSILSIAQFETDRWDVTEGIPRAAWWVAFSYSLYLGEKRSLSRAH